MLLIGSNDDQSIERKEAHLLDCDAVLTDGQFDTATLQSSELADVLIVDGDEGAGRATRKPQQSLLWWPATGEHGQGEQRYGDQPRPIVDAAARHLCPLGRLGGALASSVGCQRAALASSVGCQRAEV